MPVISSSLKNPAQLGIPLSSLPGMSKTGRELAFGRIRPVAAVAVRVVQLVTAEYVFGDLWLIALDKEGKVQRDRLAVLKGVGVLLAVAAAGSSSRRVFQRQDPAHDFLNLRIRHFVMRRHLRVSPVTRAALFNALSELFGRVGLPGVLFRDLVIRRSNDLVVRGVTGGAVA